MNARLLLLTLAVAFIFSFPHFRANAQGNTPQAQPAPGNQAEKHDDTNQAPPAGKQPVTKETGAKAEPTDKQTETKDTGDKAAPADKQTETKDTGDKAEPAGKQEAQKPAAPHVPTRKERIQAAKEALDAAEKRVKEIVNQPVTRMPRSPWAMVQKYHNWVRPGGTNTPDYAIDIRTTRQLPYARFHYVSSALNKGEMFIGEELEFNPQLKLYYEDDKLPKKRLSDKEMMEINSLYRIIGGNKALLAQLQNMGVVDIVKYPGFLNTTDGMIAQLALLSVFFLIGYKVLFRRS